MPREPDISHVFERNPPRLGAGHRDYQAAPVSGVSPRPGIAPQIPGADIGHEPRSEHRGERQRGERENIPREKKRELCVITVLPAGQNWSEGSAGGA